MNIEQANNIPLFLIVEKLGFKPQIVKSDCRWYMSPFLKQQEPSFLIKVHSNIWIDNGTMQQGGVIEFCSTYLKSIQKEHSAMDALIWLQNILPELFSVKIAEDAETHRENKMMSVRSILPLKSKRLLGFLEKQGISKKVSQEYLLKLDIKTPVKSFTAAGIENEDHGFEIINKFCRESINPRSITFIRGEKKDCKEIHIFDDFMDFLSALSVYKITRLDGDAIILNGISCLPLSLPYIGNYGYNSLITWLNNDEEGREATLLLESFAKHHMISNHTPMNEKYSPHKNVNKWLMRTLYLTGK